MGGFKRGPNIYYIVQWLAKKLAVWAIYLIKWQCLTKDFEIKKSCYPHEHLAPNSARLEASKKVLNGHVPQGAVKLQAVKVLVLKINQKSS